MLTRQILAGFRRSPNLPTAKVTSTAGRTQLPRSNARAAAAGPEPVVLRVKESATASASSRCAYSLWAWKRSPTQDANHAVPLLLVTIALLIATGTRRAKAMSGLRETLRFP
jgi:hypothetical protein